MEDLNFRKGDAKTDVFGSDRMLQPSPVERIPDGPTTPEVAYQMVKDETFAQTQPRLNLATFVTTYMDDYATKLMNEAININYIDETEYPRIAVMNGKCINIVANLWNSPEKDTWKTGALAIGSSEACMLGGVAAWLRWRKKRQAQGKPFDKPNFVISTGFQVVWEKFAQLWQIEMREVPLTLEKTTLDPEEALKMCDENTICIVPIQGVTWTGLNDDVEALDKALDAYNANPSSMSVAIKNFAEIQASPKILILGEMRELGTVSEEAHRKIVSLATENPAHTVFLVGNNFEHCCDNRKFIRHFKDTDTLIEYLKVHPLHASYIFVKGSRGNKLERIVEFL